MINVVDRVPTRPNRIKLIKENGGTFEYYTWERADEPTAQGTPINKKLFDSIQNDLNDRYTKKEVDSKISVFLTNSQANNSYAQKQHTHNNFSGASTHSSGSAGFVPAPSYGDTSSFLKSDGSWANIPDNTIAVDSQLSSSSTNPLQNKIIYAELNKKANNTVFRGATSYGSGSQGLVPSPTTNDTSKFLKGDGTWGTPSQQSIDTSLNNYSNNAIANKTVYQALQSKANTGHTHSDYAIASDVNNKFNNYYTQSQISNLLAYKADANKLGGLSFQALSQSDYDRISYKDQNTIYFIYE